MAAVPPPLPKPPWLVIARKELGVRETHGAVSTPRINEYLAVAHAAPNDETPWCSAFANWCMQQAKLPITGRLAARSWLRWGIELKQPRVGCVVVLWREDPLGAKGHVGFFVNETMGQVFLLGGNEGNAVSIHPYTKARVLSYRWPFPEDMRAIGMAP